MSPIEEIIVFNIYDTCVLEHQQCYTFPNFLSKPSCTDIMEIYNAVEEMDDDEEVSDCP